MRTQLLQTLQDEGLERIPVLGLPFDPHVSEAVGTRRWTTPTSTTSSVKELMRGYRLNGRVARPSRVVIAEYRVEPEPTPAPSGGLASEPEPALGVEPDRARAGGGARVRAGAGTRAACSGTRARARPRTRARARAGRAGGRGQPVRRPDGAGGRSSPVGDLSLDDIISRTESPEPAEAKPPARRGR